MVTLLNRCFFITILLSHYKNSIQNTSKEVNGDGEEDNYYNRIQTGRDTDWDNIVGMGGDGYKIFYRVIL